MTNINWIGEARKLNDLILEDNTNRTADLTLKGGISKSQPLEARVSKSKDNVFLTDMAQSHFYTIKLDKMFSSNSKISTEVYKDFITAQSFSYNYSIYENLSLPVNIFGGFPLLERKKVSTISISCYDFDDDRVEVGLRNWENTCFPNGKYVPYLSEIVDTLTYRSYNVEGKLNFEKKVNVILSDTVSVSRSNEENALKLIKFSLVVVGNVN